MSGSSKGPQILILDISADGHHPTYVRWILESEFAKSAKITLASRPEMFEHPQINACRTAFTAHRIDVTPAREAQLADMGTVGLVRMSWMIGRLYRETCAALTRQKTVDFVIVPYLDDCLLGLALSRQAFQGIPWMAITMRTMFHYTEMGIAARRQRYVALRRRLFYRILKQSSLRALLTIDPTLAAFAKRQSGAFMDKLGYLPDPAVHHPLLPARGEARRRLNVPSDVPLVLLYGEIAARKGVVQLLEAAADPACSPRLHILLAGRCRERGLLTSAPFRFLESEGRMHILDGYVQDAVEPDLLASADCMWLGYIDFYGMSGVLVLAARHGMPVMVPPDGLIGYLAQRYALGAVIEPRNRSSVVAALNRLVAEPEFFRRAGDNAVSAFETHDPAGFKSLVAQTIAMNT